MDSSKKTTVKLSRIKDLRGVYMGVYTEEYLWRLILLLIHTCYTSSFLPCILKENFQKPMHWIFRFFSYSCQGGLIQISLNWFTSARIWKVPSF